MKITHVTTRVLSTPADNPLVVGLPAPPTRRVGGITQWMKVAEGVIHRWPRAEFTAIR